MKKFFESTLGMFVLFLLGAAAVYVISAITSGNWNLFGTASVDPSKGTSPDASGCGGTRTTGSGVFKFVFNRPYYNEELFFKAGNEIIGVYDKVTGSYVDTIFRGKPLSISVQVLDEVEEFDSPVIGLSPAYQCTMPIYDLSNMPNASEICFESSDLGLKVGSQVPLKQRIGYRGEGAKTWRYNRQAGEKYCYVYNPEGKYPLV